MWLLWFALAVDSSKFRTCSQRGFCRRFGELRDAPAEQRPAYKVNAVWKKALMVRIELINAVAAQKLQLEVSGYESGAVRLQLRDAAEMIPRYGIPDGDVLVQGMDERRVQPNVMETATGSIIEYKYGAHTTHVTVSPDARIAISVDGTLVQVWNDGLLNFETYREKDSRPEGSPGDCGRGVDATCFGGKDHCSGEKGCWEEEFGGHTDLKPHGPQSIGIGVKFSDAKHVYGLPEHTNKLPLNHEGMDQPYRLFNADVFEYVLDSPMALYGAIPMVTGVQANGITSSLLWNNPSDSWAWTKNEESGTMLDVVSESGSWDAFVFPGPTPADTLVQYHSITGPAALPPVFSMGKHQCRWNYMDTRDVKQIDAKFDAHDIPYDVLWLDIEHTNGKRYFTWDSRNFPDSEKMIEDVASRGRKMVTIVDPHIKVDPQYSVFSGMPKWIQVIKSKQVDDPNDVKPADYDEKNQRQIPDPNAEKPADWDDEEDGEWRPAMVDNPNHQGEWRAKQITIKDAPENFDGWCWPGTSQYPDFTTKGVREYWSSLFAYDKYKGSTKNLYTWNDMNEPSVFNHMEVTMPLDAVHDGKVEHRDVHNLYGMYVHRATYEGHLLREPSERPFVLSRAFYAGSHRYGAIWTGDNTATWGHYHASVPMLLSLSLCGLSFVGADVGGFFKHPDASLITRWHQFGAMAYPFYRSHAHLESPRREPWMYGDEVVKHVRTAVRARYALMPFWYTRFAEHVHFGAPIVRPLWFDHPTDAKAHGDAQNQALIVGADVLVAAAQAAEKGGSVPVYLPGEQGWYDYWTGVRTDNHQPFVVNSAENVPVFVRAGAILPKKVRARRSTTAQRLDPYTLAVYLDRQGEASGRLYVDDGHTRQHLDGAYIYQEFSFKAQTLRSAAVPLGEDQVLAAPASQPSFAEPSIVGLGVERIDVFGSQATKASLEVGGQKTELTTVRAGDVLTVKLPGIQVAKHDWQIIFS